MLPINYLAVLVAAVVAFVLAFLFHGPLLGKWWMQLADVHPTGNEKFSDMVPQLFWNLVVDIVTAYALAVLYVLASTSPYMSTSAVWNGIIVAVIVWLGFLVTSSSIGVIWMKQKMSLWLFEAGCSLVVMVAMGAIIAAW